MKITELTAVTLGKKIKAKEITVAEAVSAVLEQIEAVEGDVHAYVTLKDKEKVLKKAESNPRASPQTQGMARRRTTST